MANLLFHRVSTGAIAATRVSFLKNTVSGRDIELGINAASLARFWHLVTSDAITSLLIAS